MPHARDSIPPLRCDDVLTSSHNNNNNNNKNICAGAPDGYHKHTRAHTETEADCLAPFCNGDVMTSNQSEGPISNNTQHSENNNNNHRMQKFDGISWALMGPAL